MFSLKFWPEIGNVKDPPTPCKAKIPTFSKNLKWGAPQYPIMMLCCQNLLSGLKVIPSPLHLNGAIPYDDFDTRYPECCNKRQGNSHKINKKFCMTKTIVRSKNEAKEKKRASLWQEFVQKCTVIAIPKRWVEMRNFKFVFSLREGLKNPQNLRLLSLIFSNVIFNNSETFIRLPKHCFHLVRIVYCSHEAFLKTLKVVRDTK